MIICEVANWRNVIHYGTVVNPAVNPFTRLWNTYIIKEIAQCGLSCRPMKVEGWVIWQRVEFCYFSSRHRGLSNEIACVFFLYNVFIISPCGVKDERKPIYTATLRRFPTIIFLQYQLFIEENGISCAGRGTKEQSTYYFRFSKY